MIMCGFSTGYRISFGLLERIVHVVFAVVLYLAKFPSEAVLCNMKLQTARSAGLGFILNPIIRYKTGCCFKSRVKIKDPWELTALSVARLDFGAVYCAMASFISVCTSCLVSWSPGNK